jgi:glycosyltransferase involved in cell wall biosynthesis
MKYDRLKVLCLDKEGGYGGSSRSLFQSIKHISSSEIDVEVWCKRRGPIQERYQTINVRTEVHPNMPSYHSLPKISRNLFALTVFFIYDWPQSFFFRRKLLEKVNKVDVIHLNIDGFYWLSRWLGKRTDTPIVMHKRTNPWVSIFSRFQMKIIARYVSRLVFITEENEKNYIELGGRINHGVVIYNITPRIDKLPKPLKDIPNDNRFKVCTLANYSYLRGIDRLIDVAKIIKGSGFNKVLFVVAGNISLTRSLPGELGKVAKSGGNLSDYAKKMGVDDMFTFLGHVNNPERVLSGCNVLIRPSRENNPWGRDVLEALSFGIPVIATGTYNRFVDNEITGFLLGRFNPSIVAEKIVMLSNDYHLVEHLGIQGRERVTRLCNGPKCAKDLLNIWQEVSKQ